MTRLTPVRAPSPRKVPRRFLLFAALSLFLGLGFVVSRILSPSDGARLVDGADAYQAEALVITPYDAQPGGLRAGDRVTAVDGQPVTAIASDLFQRNSDRPTYAFGDTLVYQLERGDQTFSQPVTLGRLPVRAILADHWGVLLFASVSQLVAAFVLWRRPHDPAARALFIWAFAGSHSYAWSFFVQAPDLGAVTPFWWFRAATPGLWLIYWAAGLHVALVFPRPLPLVQRYPRLVDALYPAAFALFFLYLAATGGLTPAGSPLLYLGRWIPAETVVSVLFVTFTLVTITFQYVRNARGPERAKIRLVVFAALVGGGLGTLLWVIVPALLGREILSANALGLLVLLFPLSLGAAIWRHHLFDIEVIIQRTLVYTILTALLGLVYFSSVVVLQAIFRALTGQDTNLAIVFSTLAIAVLFQPLRRRIQAIIDRRFYRRRYDAAQTLTQFGRTVRDEMELEQLAATLVAVICETMQPEQVSLWLNPARSEEQRQGE